MAFMSKPCPPRPDLDKLIRESKAYVDSLTPEQKREMIRKQAESFVRAEAGFGSDADEAEYAKALHDGDTEKLARLNAEAAERVLRVQTIMDRR
jgi:glutamyl/glutaminyl-tRNA synthetase